MTSRTLLLSLTVFAMICLCGPVLGAALAEDVSYPYIAESVGDNVNVRAGQSANFERLCQLHKGEEVIVLGKKFSWYKIQLPPSANVYVNKEYIQFLGMNAGGVAAANVNIRAGIGIHHTVLGSLSKGEQIYIQEDLDDWYRIEPVSGIYGWVSDEYLRFKKADLTGYPVAPERTFAEAGTEAEGTGENMEEPTEMTPQEPQAEISEEAAPEKEETYVPPQGMITSVGYVETHEGGADDGIYFKIVAEGQPVCYIKGVNHLLGRFVHQQVSVEGTVLPVLSQRYKSPVIVVLKVRLII